jgi:hypothetical protein
MLRSATLKDRKETANIMATNPPSGDGHRNGAVRQRSQVQNPKTGVWIKRDAGSGRFMDGKSGGTRFKGVRREK